MNCFQVSTRVRAKGLPKFVVFTTHMKLFIVIGHSQHFVRCIDHLPLVVGNLELVMVFWVGLFIGLLFHLNAVEGGFILQQGILDLRITWNISAY